MHCNQQFLPPWEVVHQGSLGQNLSVCLFFTFLNHPPPSELSQDGPGHPAGRGSWPLSLPWQQENSALPKDQSPLLCLVECLMRPTEKRHPPLTAPSPKSCNSLLALPHCWPCGFLLEGRPELINYAGWRVARTLPTAREVGKSQGRQFWGREESNFKPYAKVPVQERVEQCTAPIPGANH